MARNDTGFYIASGLSGILQGLREGEKDRRARALEQKKLDLLGGESGLKKAKLKADLAKEGFTETGDIDPGFYTPPNAVSPEAMGSLDMGQVAAGVAGDLSFPGASPAPAVANAKSQIAPAPEGNPSYLRAKWAAELEQMKRAGSARGTVLQPLSEVRRIQEVLGGAAPLPGDENLMLRSGFSNVYSPGKPMQGLTPADAEAAGIIPPGTAGKFGAKIIPTGALPSIKTKPAPPPKPVTTIGDAYTARGLAIPAKFKGRENEPATPEMLRLLPSPPRPDKKGDSKTANALKLQQQTANIVAEDIKRALDLIENDYYASGSLMGLGKVLPGSSSNRLEKLLSGIKANISFEKLQALRQASPTGGALGSVSDADLRILQDSAGRIEPNMHSEDLKFNLRRLLDQFNTVIHGNPSDQRYAGTLGGKSPPAAGEVREYSPSRNQTRVLRNGKLVQVLDGDQR